MGDPVVRPATADDLVAYFGAPPDCTMRAWVWDVDGEPLGVAGVRYFHPFPYVFSDMKPGMRRFPRSIVRGGLAVMEDIGDGPLYALANENEPGAVRFLTRLGFRHFDDTSLGQLFVWRKGAAQ